MLKNVATFCQIKGLEMEPNLQLTYKKAAYKERYEIPDYIRVWDQPFIQQQTKYQIIVTL